MNESTAGGNKSSCNNTVCQWSHIKNQKQVKIIGARDFTIAVERILGHPDKSNVTERFLVFEKLC